MKKSDYAVEVEFKRRLAEMGQIALIWGIDDVQETAKEMGVELTSSECWKILQEVEHNHLAEQGVNWVVIQIAINEHCA